MTKQNITFLKTQKFIRTYPNILFFQHNNLSVSQWFQLRTQFKTMESVNVLLLKNTLIQNVLLQQNVSNPSLFQGPCFALGFSNSSQFSDIVKITRQKPTIVLLGGLVNNQFLNHLDIAKILELDTQVHETFLTSLNQSTHVHTSLTECLSNSVNQLDQISWNLLECLEFLKLKRSSVIYCLCLNIRSQSNRRFPYGYLVTTSLQLSPTLWDFSPYILRSILVH